MQQYRFQFSLVHCSWLRQGKGEGSADQGRNQSDGGAVCTSSSHSKIARYWHWKCCLLLW